MFVLVPSVSVCIWSWCVGWHFVEKLLLLVYECVWLDICWFILLSALNGCKTRKGPYKCSLYAVYHSTWSQYSYQKTCILFSEPEWGLFSTIHMSALNKSRTTSSICLLSDKLFLWDSMAATHGGILIRAWLSCASVMLKITWQLCRFLLMSDQVYIWLWDINSSPPERTEHSNSIRLIYWVVFLKKRLNPALK